MFMRKAPQTKAERRAEHNAIERARRETLNGKFQKLAEALPNLQNYRRPSKGQIVEKALDWVRQSIHREDKYHYQLLQLQRENKRLLMQLNLQQQQHTLSQPISSQSSDGHPTPPPGPLPSAPSASLPTPMLLNSSSYSPMAPSPYSLGSGSRRGSCFEEDDIIDYPFPILPMTAPSSIATEGMYAPQDMYLHTSHLASRSMQWQEMKPEPTMIHPTEIHPTEIPPSM
ncbi:hypothetical protein DM01DRAFT_1346282 [Hesseltinella vesiculosa]|uniref:BHLH domain-containing protein n=1 Tax=Hesseltinella vesiculosa TaxID=101127 RepID=A0A1X2GGF3_9FUNG|nr:hypothetical protein DM01DRAFT_1346282 [Hesseltinella vesiculosa]